MLALSLPAYDAAARYNHARTCYLPRVAPRLMITHARECRLRQCGMLRNKMFASPAAHAMMLIPRDMPTMPSICSPPATPSMMTRCHLRHVPMPAATHRRDIRHMPSSTDEPMAHAVAPSERSSVHTDISRGRHQSAAEASPPPSPSHKDEAFAQQPMLVLYQRLICRGRLFAAAPCSAAIPADGSADATRSA